MNEEQEIEQINDAIQEGFSNSEAMIAYAEENGRISAKRCENCKVSCKKILSEFQSCPVLSGVSGFESKSHKIAGFRAFLQGFREKDPRITSKMAGTALKLFEASL